MIRESDIQWWILEATKHPKVAPEIIEEIAKRLVELDAENERLRNELLRFRSHTPASSRNTRVEALQHKVETLQDLLQHGDATDAFLVLLSDSMQALRVSLPHARELAAEGRRVLNIRAMLTLHSIVSARPGDELFVLTNKGRGFKCLLADVPSLSPDQQKAKGHWPAMVAGELEAGERPAVILSTGTPPRFWTVVTRRAYVQRLVRVACDQKIARGEPLVKSSVGKDEPVAVVSGDRRDLLVMTRWGKAVRFAQRVIEAQGSIALDLEMDDQAVTALALDGGGTLENGALLIATASGYAMRRKSSDVRTRTRPGSAGKALIHAHDVLAAFELDQAALTPELLFLTYGGNLVFAPTVDVPLSERLSKGTLLHDLGQDPAVAVTLVR